MVTKVINEPIDGIYRKSVLKYKSNGESYYDWVRYEIQIIGETAKSYKIRFKDNGGFGRQTWVRKSKVIISYLRNDYCLLRNKFLPKLACTICNKKCLLSGKPYP